MRIFIIQEVSPPSPSVCFQPESLLRNFEFVAIVRWLESTFTFLSSLDHHIQLPICLDFYPLRRQLLLLFVILAVFWFILMPLANEDAEYLPFRSSNTFSASQKTCFSVCFKMGKEILKKKKKKLKPKNKFSRAPLWTKMFDTASLRFTISQDTDGLSLAEVTAISQKMPQAALCNTTSSLAQLRWSQPSSGPGTDGKGKKPKLSLPAVTARNSVIPLIMLKSYALPWSRNLLSAQKFGCSFLSLKNRN